MFTRMLRTGLIGALLGGGPSPHELANVQNLRRRQVVEVDEDMQQELLVAIRAVFDHKGDAAKVESLLSDALIEGKQLDKRVLIERVNDLYNATSEPVEPDELATA